MKVLKIVLLVCTIISFMIFGIALYYHFNVVATIVGLLGGEFGFAFGYMIGNDAKE